MIPRKFTVYQNNMAIDVYVQPSLAATGAWEVKCRGKLPVYAAKTIDALGDDEVKNEAIVQDSIGSALKCLSDYVERLESVT